MNNEISKLSTLAKSINERHLACEDAARSTIEHARDAGDALIEAKAQVPHGEWISWLSENVECSKRSAQAYMRVANQWDRLPSNAQSTAHLTLNEGLKLLADEPMPTVNEDLIPPDGYATICETETDAGTVEVLISPGVEGYYFLTIKGPFDRETSALTPTRYNKRPFIAYVIRRTVERWIPEGVDFDDLEWGLQEWGEDDWGTNSTTHICETPEFDDVLTDVEAERLKSLTADVHASMQQIIDSASAAAELTGESVEDVLTEHLSDNPAILEMVMHKLKLPA
jgi:hypothetical protein